MGPHAEDHSDNDMEMSNGIKKSSMDRTEMDKVEGKSCMTFEDAMSMTGFGKFNVLSIFFVGFILLGMILETLGFSYVIPACQCDLDLTLTQKGWVAAIPFIGIILTSHMWGYLADTRGRKKILVFSMTVGSFFSLLSSFSPNLGTFAALRFMASVFISAASSLGYAYLGEITPNSHRDISLTLGNGFVAVGTAVVPLMAWAVLPLDFHYNLGFISDYRPWRLLITLFALPYMICCVIFVYFPESPKYLAHKGDTSEALNVLKKIFSINTGKPAEDFPVSEIRMDGETNRRSEDTSIIKDIWNQTVPLFKIPYLRYSIITCYLQFCTFAVTNGFYIWYPTVLNKVFNNEHLNEGLSNMCEVLNSEEVNIYVAENVTMSSMISTCDDSLKTKTFSVSILLACIVSTLTMICAFLIKRTGKRNILIGIFVFTALCSMVMHWISNTFVAVVIFSAMQLSGTCIGLINAYVVEIYPTSVRAMAVCLTLMIGRVGSVFGTNLIGLLIETLCPASFFFFGGILLSSGLVCFMLPTKKLDLTVAEKENEENDA